MRKSTAQYSSPTAVHAVVALFVELDRIMKTKSFEVRLVRLVWMHIESFEASISGVEGYDEWGHQSALAFCVGTKKECSMW